MDSNQKKLRFVKATCWLGVAADALWVPGLLFPWAFALLTGDPGFAPDLQVRLIMGMGASLMAGWTLLLVWVAQRPIERRAVLLFTAFPVVAGMFAFALVGYLDGNRANLWLIFKTVILMIAMVASYLFSGSMVKKTDDSSPEQALAEWSQPG